MIGIPFSVLKAEAERKKKTTKETAKAPEPPKQVQPSNPSGSLELCLPCLDDNTEMGQVESFEDDDSSILERPVVAKHWLKNMELVGKEEENVSLDKNSISFSTTEDNQSLALFSSEKEDQNIEVESFDTSVTPDPCTTW